MRALLTACFIGTVGVQAVLAEESRIAFPSGYANSFTNYLSLDRTQNPDQVIRLFANEIAVEGVRKTGEFPDGSVLVAEIYKAKKDDQEQVIESSLGRRVRDQFALVAVMEKQKGWGAAFPDGLKNGDWDFAAFKPDGSMVEKDLNACRACHAPLTDLRHVFSYEHLR